MHVEMFTILGRNNMSDKIRRIVKRSSEEEKCSYFDPMLEVDVENVAFNVAADHYKLNIGTVVLVPHIRL